MSRHVHAGMIIKWANDPSQKVWYRGPGGFWCLINGIVTWEADCEYHVGPNPPTRMIETECGSYPEPLREAPPVGTPIFVAGTSIAFQAGWWTGGRADMEQLRVGLFHLTLEAAEAQCRVERALRMKRHGGAA